MLKQETTMYKYDVLRDTWIYQEIKQEVLNDLIQQRLQGLHQVLLEIVLARFPRLEQQTRKIGEQITDPELLQSLIVKISIARVEKDAKQALSGLSAASPSEQQ